MDTKDKIRVFDDEITADPEVFMKVIDGFSTTNTNLSTELTTGAKNTLRESYLCSNCNKDMSHLVDWDVFIVGKQYCSIECANNAQPS